MCTGAVFRKPRARFISNNGRQFIARDFKEFFWICGMTHVRTSTSYLLSLKTECVRPGMPLSPEEARPARQRTLLRAFVI